MQSFALLMILSVSYSAAVGRLERLRLAVTSVRVPTMTGVWTFAGAMALPIPLLSLLVGVVFLADWPARQAAGQPLGRYLYSAATAAVAYLAAATVHNHVANLAGVGIAISTFTVLNVGFIACAIVASGQTQVLRMLCSPRAHAIEIGTQSLGAVLGLALQWHHGAGGLLAVPLLLATHHGVLRDAVAQTRTFDPVTGLWREDAWKVRAAELVNDGRQIGVITVCPDQTGRERLISAALLDCVRPSDPRGRVGSAVVVATFVRTPAGGRLIADRISRRLEDLAVPCTVGCATAADLDTDAMLVESMFDAIARRAAVDDPFAADHW